MGTYKKINGQAIPVTTEGHPQYFFDTKAQAEAALSTLEVGADVFVEKGGNEDVLPRVQELEEDVSEINSNLTALHTLVWTNPNPTSDFAGQTINVDLSAYDHIFVSAKDGCGFVRIGQSGTLSTLWYNNGVVGYVRAFSPSSSDIVVADATAVHTGATTNSRLVPIKIYGVKMD